MWQKLQNVTKIPKYIKSLKVQTSFCFKAPNVASGIAIFK